MQHTDISAIISGHTEGRLAIASLRSMLLAVEEANKNGLSVQIIAVLDNPDSVTRSVFENFANENGVLLEVNYADQGASRNEALEKATGQKIAFLDADDLWCKNWLCDAFRFLEKAESGVIAHPEFNYFFEGQATVFRHIDQDDEEFQLDLLRLQNYWDALCMCDREVYKTFPFYKRELDKGWAYEDWYWNCETVAAGLRHKIVPDTILFKRRRSISQTVRASSNKSRIRNNALMSYSNSLFSDI